ncbi:MAG: hypothetical protein ABIJ97_01650 [Bacteroidota bacterium]
MRYRVPEYNTVFFARSILQVVTGEEVPDCPEVIGNKVMKISMVNAEFNDDKSGFYLGDNYPDPVSYKTTIPYILPEGVTGKIIIKDMLGKTIAEYDATGGENLIEVDCSSLAMGTYVYGLIVEDLLLEYKQMIISR